MFRPPSQQARRATWHGPSAKKRAALLCAASLYFATGFWKDSAGNSTEPVAHGTGSKQDARLRTHAPLGSQKHLTTTVGFEWEIHVTFRYKYPDVFPHPFWQSVMCNADLLLKWEVQMLATSLLKTIPHNLKVPSQPLLMQEFVDTFCLGPTRTS